MLRIVTDSTCRLTRAEAAALGADVLPMSYVVSGSRHEEGAQGEDGDFGALLSADPSASTEPVYPARFAEAFRRLVEAGHDVLCVTMSGRLSGAYRAACDGRDAVVSQLAEAGMDVSSRIRLVDSRLTVAALELCLRRARRLADEGLPLEEVARGVERFRDEVRIAFAVPDMRPLRRSGRLGATHRSVMRLLDRWPLFSLDTGGIRTEGSGKGPAGAARALVGLVDPAAREVVVSTFGGASAPAARAAMLELRRRLPGAKVLVKDGGPVIACHIGVGSVSLTWVAAEGD